MALDFGMNQNFSHSQSFDQGMGASRPGASTATVALDGTGDFANIQEAIDALPNAGGVVYIKEGTYVLSVSIEINKDNVTLIGAGIATVLDGAGNGGDMVAINISGKSNIILNNFKILGRTGGFFADQRGIKIVNPTDINIDSLWITGGRFHGIDIQGTAGKVTVTNCHIYSQVGMGIYCTAGSNNIISNNQIYSNGDDGVYLAPAHDSTITGNIIIGNYRGIVLHNSDTSTVTGNRITENTNNQIVISKGGVGTSTKNVIVGNAYTTTTGGTIVDGGTSSVIANNAA